MSEYFEELTVDGDTYWRDVQGRMIYSVDQLFDYFGADAAHLRETLPLIWKLKHSADFEAVCGDMTPYQVQQLSDIWRRLLRFNRDHIAAMEREAQYLESHGYNTLQEAIDDIGQHAVEKSIGMRL